METATKESCLAVLAPQAIDDARRLFTITSHTMLVWPHGRFH